MKELILRSIVIRTTPNNLIITLLDDNNKVINWTSKGFCPFMGRGNKKLNWRSFLQRLEPTIDWLNEHDSVIKNLIFKGKVPFLKKTLTVFKKRKLRILAVKLERTIPHNGCKLPKIPRK